MIHSTGMTSIRVSKLTIAARRLRFESQTKYTNTEKLKILPVRGCGFYEFKFLRGYKVIFEPIVYSAAAKTGHRQIVSTSQQYIILILATVSF